VTTVELWFARDGTVPLRDQLATQLMLAIASGELAPGKRLPSTRALAKRFRLNANTVSAAYQQLEALGWVQSMRGSGVYVRSEPTHPAEAQFETLDRLVVPFLRLARSAGLSANAVRERLDHWLAVRPRRFVFVHPDSSLRVIIVEELRRALTWQIDDCELHASAVASYIGDSIFLTLPSKHTALCSAVPAGVEVVALHIRQVDRALSRYLPVRAEVLPVIVSAWPGFLEIANTILTAAGWDSEGLLFRNAADEDWQRGLSRGSVVVCDTLISAAVPPGVHKIVFALVSDQSVAALKTYERFFCE